MGKVIAYIRLKKMDEVSPAGVPAIYGGRRWPVKGRITDELNEQCAGAAFADFRWTDEKP